MFKRFFWVFSVLALLVSCGTVPISGRKQVLLVSDQEVLNASMVQYSNYIKEAPKSTSVRGKAQVVRVGKRIAAAAEAYLKSLGLEKEIRNFSWEFNLVQDKQLNAFCMPGGKIVVYEGLLSIVGSDDELAVVLGHEVAHAVAKHSNERMSQQLLAQLGAQVVNLSLDQKSEATRRVVNQMYGLGAQFGVMLPFSRKHELEADHMGLILMRLAGYNPDVALDFWKKMASGSKGSVPEIVSTHPSDRRRIEELSRLIPEVKKTYQPLG